VDRTNRGPMAFLTTISAVMIYHTIVKKANDPLTEFPRKVPVQVQNASAMRLAPVDQNENN